jgi:UDP-N-acetyl-D-glucosamine dehydrogenase
MELLLKKGSVVSYNDPYIPKLPPNTQSSSFTYGEPKHSHPRFWHPRDCVVIMADHSAYDWKTIIEQACLVVDTRGATRDLKAVPGRVVRA